MGVRVRWGGAVVAAAALVAGGLAGPAAAATATPRESGAPYFAWGSNNFGQLGDGTTNDQDNPEAVSLPGGVPPIAVSAGTDFGLALGADGRIYSWGSDAGGQLGDGSTTDRSDPEPITLPGGVPAAGISAGSDFALALGADGQVYWWGVDPTTQPGNAQPTPIAIALPGGDKARSVAAFGTSATAIGVDGKLFGWGNDSDDSLAVPNASLVAAPQQIVLPGDDPAVSVAIGLFGFGLAAGADGKLFSWGGFNGFGNLGNGGTGTQPTPAEISLPGGVAARSVAAGDGYSLALGADGHVYAWGFSQSGALGNGVSGPEQVMTPVAIALPGGASAAAIASSNSQTSFAIDTDGTLYAWGLNIHGLIGDGTNNNSASPKAVPIPGGASVGQVSAGNAVLAVSATPSDAQGPPQFFTPHPSLTTLDGATYSTEIFASDLPTYSLVDAPSWLSVTPTGAVIGTPPAGTTSFSYTVAADNAAGSAQAGPFTVTVQPAATATGTVIYSDGAAPVADTVVDACVTGTEECQRTTTADDGSYSVQVPVGTSVVLTGYPLPHTSNTAASTSPLPATAAGLQNETIELGGVSPLSAGLQVNGSSEPTLYWGSPANATLGGCHGGFGMVTVVGQNISTGDYDTVFTPLTEDAFGSGNYTGVVPALAPVHGPAQITSSIACPPRGPLMPSEAPAGTTVLVTGSGFTGATAVSFGAAAASSFTVLDDGDIQAVAPPGTGTVSVTVQTGGGVVTVGQYTYMAVTSVSPASGAQTGGTAVLINGTGLGSAATVTFGGISADFTQISDTQISAISPPGTGTQDVSVQSLYGLNTPTTAADQFTYGAGGSGSNSSSRTDVHAASDKLRANAARSTAVRTTAVHADIAGVSSSQVMDDVNGFIQHFPGIPQFVKAIASAGELIAHPSCSTAQQATIDTVMAALQPQIKAFSGALQVALELGIGAALAATGVGAAAIEAVEAYLATPAAQLALGLAVRYAVNWAARQGVKAATTVAYKIACPGNPESSATNAFIDPSGTVLDTNGNPIAGATVSLLRADTAAGPFNPVSTTDPGIRPSVNPQTTGADGVFHWDVVSGWYEIQASAPGCTDPRNTNQSTTTIGPYPVPPPQVGLTITLACADEPAVPTPAVTGLGATTGPSAGGDTVAVFGSGFTPSSTVDFGTTPAPAVTYLSANELTATTPAGSGAVDVTVLDGTAASATSNADQYFFGSAPTVTGLSTANGPASGGTAVTVTGTGFTGASALYFGNLPATSFSVTSDTQIQAVAPAESAGTVHIQVATPAGTSAQTAADQFTYQAAGPSIDGKATVTGTDTATANLTASTPGDLVVAFVAADGPRDSSQHAKVSGGGLTWTLAKRTNGQLGTAEIWTARAAGALSAAAITATLAKPGYGEALTVLAFAAAPGTGATAGASAHSGAPTATLTTTAANSWVFAVGNDWTDSIPRTLGPGQNLVSESTDSAGDTYWVQNENAPTPVSGTAVTVDDTAPTLDMWNLALIEIR